jgi:hypothetical protein
MRELTDIIGNATQSIEAGYFRLNIAGGDSIYRERVYCYELYHQMRKKWPKRTPYYLNGEVDKARHPILSELGILSKPDLLVHRPGYMEGNHAIIEIKHSRAANDGLEKDLDTLSLFLSKVEYERAILLIYGDKADDISNSIARIAATVKDLGKIELWLHQAVGQAAQHVTTLGPRAWHPQ